MFTNVGIHHLQNSVKDFLCFTFFLCLIIKQTAKFYILSKTNASVNQSFKFCANQFLCACRQKIMWNVVLIR